MAKACRYDARAWIGYRLTREDIMQVVGESDEDAFKKYNVAEHRQWHTCSNCGLKYKYQSVRYFSGYVVFDGLPHDCDKKFWGSKAIPISKKEKEYWNKIL